MVECKNVCGDDQQIHDGDNDDDPRRWQVIVLDPKAVQDSRLGADAIVGVFFVYDQTVTGGVRMAVRRAGKCWTKCSTAKMRTRRTMATTTLSQGGARRRVEHREGCSGADSKRRGAWRRVVMTLGPHVAQHQGKRGYG